MFLKHPLQLHWAVLVIMNTTAVNYGYVNIYEALITASETGKHENLLNLQGRMLKSYKRFPVTEAACRGLLLLGFVCGFLCNSRNVAHLKRITEEKKILLYIPSS